MQYWHVPPLRIDFIGRRSHKQSESNMASLALKHAVDGTMYLRIVTHKCN